MIFFKLSTKLKINCLIKNLDFRKYFLHISLSIIVSNIVNVFSKTLLNT